MRCMACAVNEDSSCTSVSTPNWYRYQQVGTVREEGRAVQVPME